MWAKIALVALCCFFACQALIFDSVHLMNNCQNNTGCPGGCCYRHHLGSRCHNYSQELQPCHLPNHHVAVMLYPCGCRPDLTCQEIHFSPDQHVIDANGTDPLGQVEQLLLGHGYGLCKA